MYTPQYQYLFIEESITSVGKWLASQIETTELQARINCYISNRN